MKIIGWNTKCSFFNNYLIEQSVRATVNVMSLAIQLNKYVEKKDKFVIVIERGVFFNFMVLRRSGIEFFATWKYKINVWPSLLGILNFILTQQQLQFYNIFSFAKHGRLKVFSSGLL